MAFYQLYQENPRVKSTFTLYNTINNRSFTDSLEAYQHGANKEAAILRKNGRLPTADIVIHFLQEFHVRDIMETRTKIFRYLKEHGLEAVANVELTHDIRGNPNNKVHFHILTDDPRSKRELKLLFYAACNRRGLVRCIDYSVSHCTLIDPDGYIDYFVKRRQHSKEVVLFQTGLLIRKFYEIGRWFNKPKSELWQECIQEWYGTEPINDPASISEVNPPQWDHSIRQ